MPYSSNEIDYAEATAPTLEQILWTEKSRPDEVLHNAVSNYIQNQDWISWQNCAMDTGGVSEIAYSAFPMKYFSNLINDRDVDENVAINLLNSFAKRHSRQGENDMLRYTGVWFATAILTRRRGIVEWVLHRDQMKEVSLHGYMFIAATKWDFHTLQILTFREDLLQGGRDSTDLKRIGFAKSLSASVSWVCGACTEEVALVSMMMSCIEHVVHITGEDSTVARYISKGIERAIDHGHIFLLARLISYPFGVPVLSLTLPDNLQQDMKMFHLTSRANRRLKAMIEAHHPAGLYLIGCNRSRSVSSEVDTSSSSSS